MSSTSFQRDREEKPVYEVVHSVVLMSVSLCGSTKPSRRGLRGPRAGGMEPFKKTAGRGGANRNTSAMTSSSVPHSMTAADQAERAQTLAQ